MILSCWQVILIVVPRFPRTGVGRFVYAGTTLPKFDPGHTSYTIRDSFRTFCRAPTVEMREVFEELRELRRTG